MDFDILCGDSAEVLKQFDDNTFDSVITDPPYGISFLNKDWDKHTGKVELWEEVFRVMKPGAHLLGFSAPRTCHRLASNLEEVGFEIRDQIMWLYSSGFPKGQDVGKGVQKVLGVNKWGDEVSVPDINGSNLAKSYEGDPYGTVRSCPR